MRSERFQALHRLATLVAICTFLMSLSSPQTEARRSRRSSSRSYWASYPLPERNWIRSGIWAFGSTESDHYYHTFRCPLMRRTKAQFLVGWSSVQEALANGYEPHPGCHAPDPRKDTSPGAVVTRAFNRSVQLRERSTDFASRGNLPMASQYMSTAWIAYGDALMMMADMEKRAGRSQNADTLYTQAVVAYGSSQLSSLPPIPAFGQRPGQAGGGGGSAPAGGAGPGGPGGPAMTAPGGGGAPAMPPGGAGPPAVR